MSIANRIVIVTGSSSGNGRAIPMRLANDGAAVVVCSDLRPDTRSGGYEEEPNVPTHDLINKRGGRAISSARRPAIPPT